MNRDIDLLLKVYGTYRHLTRSNAVQAVADSEGLPVKTVSGMVTRAYNSKNGKTALLKHLQTNAPKHSRTMRMVQEVVTRGRGKVLQHQLRIGNYDFTAVKIPDLHMPYTDTDALNVVYKIIDDLDNVAYVNALDDALDYTALGLHEDKRPPYSQAIDHDLLDLYYAYGQHLQAVQDITAGKALQVAIAGNHDIRIVNKGTYPLLTTMQELEGIGVTFIDSMHRQNIFEINQNLVWTHGFTASANTKTVATNNQNTVRRYLADSRANPDIVYGHTHRQDITRVNGAIGYNSGCLCHFDMAYLRHKPDWQLGFTVSRCNINGWHDTQNVKIEQDSNGYFAYFNGKRY